MKSLLNHLFTSNYYQSHNTLNRVMLAGICFSIVNILGILIQNCHCRQKTGLSSFHCIFLLLPFTFKLASECLHGRRQLQFPVAVIQLNHKIVSRLPSMRWKDNLIYEFINQIISFKWILKPDTLWSLSRRGSVLVQWVKSFDFLLCVCVLGGSCQYYIRNHSW